MNDNNNVEVTPPLLSYPSINPFINHDSPSRIQMFSSHMKQSLVLLNSTRKKIQTGLEKEYGKYTFKIEMPEDGIIIAVIPRYKTTDSFDSIVENPEIVVIYESLETRQIGIIRLPKFCCNHIYFGFEYVQKEGMNKLSKGNIIQKGTVFLDSPSVTSDGDYKYGIEANVAFLTLNEVAEDGFIVSESFIKKLAFKKFENRVVEFGNKKIPLNIYGDKNNYKIFPDIGEYVKDDGLLMALRDTEPQELCIIERSIDGLMRVDKTFDHHIYAAGGNGKIIDIKTYHDINNRNQNVNNFEKQCEKYDNSKRKFLELIHKEYLTLSKLKGDALQVSPEFHNLIVKESLISVNESKDRLNKLYRISPLDVWRIEFTIEYTVYPTIGFKLTDQNGGKGVIVKILPDNEMPYDSDGNIADIITDGNATVNRMNPGRKYEQYFNSASRDTHKKICRMLSIDYNKINDLSIKEINNTLKKKDNNQINEVFDYLLNYYKIVSPYIYGWYVSGKIKESKLDYLCEIVKNGIYLYIPVNDKKLNKDKVLEIENSIYKPIYGPLYFNINGQVETTKDNCRIGSIYCLLLEKTGDEWSAVSSSKIQHHGVLAAINKNDKYSRPAKEQAVRAAGDQETRIIGSYTLDDETLSELFDRNNNPSTHKVIVQQILSADKCTNIDSLIDRRKYPYGGSKPLQHANHILFCSGVKFAYKKGNSDE